MKTFACAAKIRIIDRDDDEIDIKQALFASLVEAEYEEIAEQKLIRYIKRAYPNGKIIQINLTDRYFTDDTQEMEWHEILPDFEIEE